MGVATWHGFAPEPAVAIPYYQSVVRANHLLQNLHSKPLAQELAALGAALVPGDMDQRAELDSAFQGADAVFSVQNFWLPNVGFEGEVRQGETVIDAAKAAGVKHFVYTSVGSADNSEGQKHFDSKYLIQQYLKASGLPYTILRPAFFMENFNFPWTRPLVLNGMLPSFGLRPDKTMQMIAVQDIAAFTALVLADPQKYLGQTFELAGDELTETQMAATLAKVIGRPVTVTAPATPTSYGGPSSEEMMAMHRFVNGVGYTCQIPALRLACPGLLTLEQYLRQSGWENAAPVPPSQGQGAWG